MLEVTGDGDQFSSDAQHFKYIAEPVLLSVNPQEAEELF